MRYDATKIEAAFQRLVGLPLFEMNNAAGMQSFQFGMSRTVPSALKGRSPRVVGDFALHVQCPWRMVDKKHVVITSSEQPNDTEMWLQRMRTITTVRSEERGGLTINLSDGSVLTISPDDQPGEHWRLLQPGLDVPHLVLTSAGLE